MASLAPYALAYNRVKSVVRAIHRHSLDVVKAAIPARVHVDQPFIPFPGGLFTYFTLLAVEHNAVEILMYLIEVDADALVRNYRDQNLFVKVALTPTLSSKIVDLLFIQENYGEHLNEQFECGNTLIHVAVIARNVYALESALKMGPFYVSSIRNNSGDTALALSIKLARGNPSIPLMLVKHAFKYNEMMLTPDNDGNTAIDLANMYDLPDVATHICSKNEELTPPSPTQSEVEDVKEQIKSEERVLGEYEEEFEGSLSLYDTVRTDNVAIAEDVIDPAAVDLRATPTKELAEEEEKAIDWYRKRNAHLVEIIADKDRTMGEQTKLYGETVEANEGTITGLELELRIREDMHGEWPEERDLVKRELSDQTAQIETLQEQMAACTLDPSSTAAMKSLETENARLTHANEALKKEKATTTERLRQTTVDRQDALGKLAKIEHDTSTLRDEKLTLTDEHTRLSDIIKANGLQQEDLRQKLDLCQSKLVQERAVYLTTVKEIKENYNKEYDKLKQDTHAIVTESENTFDRDRTDYHRQLNALKDSHEAAIAELQDSFDEELANNVKDKCRLIKETTEDVSKLKLDHAVEMETLKREMETVVDGINTHCNDLLEDQKRAFKNEQSNLK